MAPFSVTKFLIEQWADLPLVKTDLTGKTVVVVGANVGLGLEAARHFASMNPSRLILACRSISKGEAAMSDIQKTTGCQTLQVWPIDLGDFASVSAFAERFDSEERGRSSSASAGDVGGDGDGVGVGDGGDGPAECRGLDLLLLNAGVATRKFERTKDGWEKSVQVNHLGTALLALLLLPHLATAAAAAAASSSPSSSSASSNAPGQAPLLPRITIVSSDAHYFVKRLPDGSEGAGVTVKARKVGKARTGSEDDDVNKSGLNGHANGNGNGHTIRRGILDTLNDERYSTMKGVMMERYDVSKLLNVFFGRALASRLPLSQPSDKRAARVTVDMVNPGLCHSSMDRELSGSVSGTLFSAMKFLIARTTEKGSHTLVHGALGGSTRAEVHGKYLSRCRVVQESALSDYVISKEGREAQERLWHETVDILRSVDSNVEGIVREYLTC